MGRRGPRPTPTALRLLHGNPGNRPINGAEPKPGPGRPRCPKWLDAEAKKKWRQLAPMLEVMRVLSEVDADALVTYCQTWSRWLKAEQFVQKHGEVYPIKDDTGQVRYLQQFPQVSIARHLSQMLNRYHQEFGMTPSARSRLRIAHDHTPGELEKFLAEGS